MTATPPEDWDDPQPQDVTVPAGQTVNLQFVAPAEGQGQGVQVVVQWWYDHHAWYPAGSRCAGIGGPNTVASRGEILVLDPNGVVGNIEDCRITEDAGHEVPEVFDPGEFTATVTDAQHYPQLPPGLPIRCLPFTTLWLHNGPHTVTAQYSTGGEPPTSAQAQLTIDIRNPVIVPVYDAQHPALLQWSPDDPSGQTRTKKRYHYRVLDAAIEPVSVDFAVYDLYRSAPTDDAQGPDWTVALEHEIWNAWTDTTLDIAADETCVLTYSCDAADGATVQWFASNGTLSAETTQVANGETSVTLTCANAQPGQVIVSVVCGDFPIYWGGEFINTAGLELLADQATLAGGGPAGTVAVPWLGAWEEYPYTGSTTIQIRRGTPGAVVNLNASASAGGPTVQVTPSTVQLDGNGTATVNLAVTAVGAADLSQVTVTAASPDRVGQTRIPHSRDPQVTGAVQQTTSKFASFARQVGVFCGLVDANNATEVAVSVAGGCTAIGDLGAVAKNLWRLATSPGEFNGPEFVLSGLGLLTQFCPQADVVIAGLRSALSNGAQSFARIVLGKLRRGIIAGGEVEELAEIVAELTIDEIRHRVRRILGSDELFERFEKLHQVLGDSLWRAVDEIADDATIRALVEVASQCEKAVLTELGDALPAVARILAADGVEAGAVVKALNNSHHSGWLVQVVTDASRLCEAEGFPKLLANLGIRNANCAKGFRYELRVGCWLQDQGKKIKAFHVELPCEEGRYSDIDIVTECGEAWQCKCVSRKVNTTRLKKWLGWALGDASVDSQKVYVAVPPGAQVSDAALEDFASTVKRRRQDIVCEVPERA